MQPTEVKKIICDNLITALKEKHPSETLSSMPGCSYNEDGKREVLYIIHEKFHVCICDTYVEISVKNVGEPDDFAVDISELGMQCIMSVAKHRSLKFELTDPSCFDGVFQEIDSIITG